MPNWGDVIREHDQGPAVVELQIRLAGFRGTIPDGDFGGGTKLQVQRFQADVMGHTAPSGVFDAATKAALDAFAQTHPVDFTQLSCPCGQCGGFGRAINRGVYYGASQVEAFHRYEYPGIHRMLLWAYRAAQFYAGRQGWQLKVNSGYRCSIDNLAHNRRTTNHMGKAIDISYIGNPTYAQKASRSNSLRGMLVHDASGQVGWAAPNRKALEPANIAPTWVHYDVRCYAPKYLADKYFVKTRAALDTAMG
jgi:Putative peptidoglycan binding domain